MPAQVPASVSRSFEALIPVALVVLLMSLITVVLDIDLHQIVDKAVAPLVKAGDSIVGVWIPVFLITFFWAFGIHGVSVVGTVARPVWEVYLFNNATKSPPAPPISPISLRKPLPVVYLNWRLRSTLGLLLAMLLFSKSEYSKSSPELVSFRESSTSMNR